MEWVDIFQPLWCILLCTVQRMPRKFSMKRRANETTTSLKRLDKVKNHRQIGPLSPVSGIEMWERTFIQAEIGVEKRWRPSVEFFCDTLSSSFRAPQIFWDFLNSQEIDKIRWNMRNSLPKLLTRSPKTFSIPICDFMEFLRCTTLQVFLSNFSSFF